MELYAVWGRCSAVVEYDMSRKVDLLLEANCISSSAAKSSLDGFFLVGTPEVAWLWSLPGLSKILWHDFKQL
jgi:hypothetical protein